MDELRALPPDKQDKEQLAAAQLKASGISTQLHDADMHLRQLRLTSTSPAIGDIDPQLQTQIISAQRKLMEAIRSHDAAERRVVAMHNDFEKKIVSTDDVVESQVELLSALRSITKAQNELDQLKAQANKAIENRNTTTAPSGSTTAPAGGSAMMPTSITDLR
ncbi:MAG: hypothetical protein EHM48_08205 [Planctomycetaceae bacterium]|nr:MAG: hypothetical protein EHM48_08205 [Planctomycetaceae bacterium]